MKVHPIFEMVLESIYPTRKPMDTPCRVMADLARHEADMRDAVNESFDETDEDHIKQIAPERLRRAIQELLLLRSAIKRTDGSFGADSERVAQVIRKDLDRLHEACIDAWRDL